MSIIDTLITDRTQADLAALQAALTVGWDNLTTEQKTAWSASKGAYNATDLNRVGEACAYLYEVFAQDLGSAVNGYVALRTDWTIAEIPTYAEMQKYISTVAALKSVWNTAQEIPSTMSRLTTNAANNIEKALIEIDRFQRNTIQSWVYSGMVYSGQLWE